jgi:hypothetical protein
LLGLSLYTTVVLSTLLLLVAIDYESITPTVYQVDRRYCPEKLLDSLIDEQDTSRLMTIPNLRNRATAVASLTAM